VKGHKNRQEEVEDIISELKHKTDIKDKKEEILVKQVRAVKGISRTQQFHKNIKPEKHGH
jgi:hypothetical protein